MEYDYEDEQDYEDPSSQFQGVPEPMPMPVQSPEQPSPSYLAAMERMKAEQSRMPSVPQQFNQQQAALPEINWAALQNARADQAAKAIAIAMQYQGMRGYQKDLANGTPAAQALSKWAPAMFYGQGSGSGMARAVIPQAAPELKEIKLPGGGSAYTYGKQIHFQKPSRNWVFEKGQEGRPDIMRDSETGDIRIVPQKTGMEAMLERLAGKNQAARATSTPAPQPAKPQKGEVYKGYRFKGGDLSKQENWEKVQ